MSAPTSIVLSFRPLDDLEESLVASYRDVSRATHRFFVLLREFDLRQGYRACGNVDCADWLNWRCGIGRVAAQEKVRVAHALWGLPRIDAAFARGDLSYSKVRALCRVATSDNETTLLDCALDATAAQVEAYCRRLRNGDADASAVDARRLHEARSLCRTFREDGSGTLTVELPQADLELVLAALEAVAKTLPHDPTRSLFATGADALLEMARMVLAGDTADGSRAPASQPVVVHVDASALSGAGGEADHPLPTVRRLTCDGTVIPLVENDRGDILDVGRTQRLLPVAMRRALFARDRACTFPGCHHTRYLEAHHVQHWADGGDTALDNLLVLCGTHHRLVHEGGFGIQRDRDGRCYFVRPDGRPVEAARVSAETERASQDRVEETRATYCSSGRDGPALTPAFAVR